MHVLPFTLELAALPDGKHRITAQKESPEQTQVISSDRFSDHEVANCLLVLSRRKHNVTPLEQIQAARQFGQRLFNFLIKNHPAIHTAYRDCLLRAGQHRFQIRLSLEDAGELAHLPWELLRDPERDFLALSDTTPVVRVPSHLDRCAPVPLILPLRVLAYGQHAQGWRDLEEATTDLRRNRQIQLDRANSLSALRLQMLAEDYHVLHVIGGGSSLVTGEEDTHPVNPGDLSHVLFPESTIRLVLIDAQREYHSTITAASLRYVPAVVTMQFSITQQATTLFMRELYGAVSQGALVDAAISKARRAIANALQTGEWAAPVLFMRSSTDVLFRLVSAVG